VNARPSGSLRIIAGELRGRRIEVPPGSAVRPTGDRAREGLFAILAPVVPGAVVLDAYAGSGALGFEALSRGARSVVFIEAERRVLECLRTSAARLGVVGQCSFLDGRVTDVLAGRRLRGPFDLILADPPYAGSEGERFLSVIGRFLAPGGTLVVEHDALEPPLSPSAPALRHARACRYGRTVFDFFVPEGGQGHRPSPG
jgi:16S rRNA (guanine966-N2)-methyltransferase